jgi:hypothetical protein
MEEIEKAHRSSRQKSPRRLQYDAQVELFRKRHGSLEVVRQKLEMRPAQICRLLKVHPSAWIRWTKTESASAPPYVYQMLEWYIDLQKIKESAAGAFDSSKSFKSIGSTASIASIESIALPPAQTISTSEMSSLQISPFWIKALVISWIFQGLILLSFVYFLRR